MRRRARAPPSLLHFAANRPREFPFAPRFGILGAPPLLSSPRMPLPSLPFPLADIIIVHDLQRRAEIHRCDACACLFFPSSTNSSPPKLLLFSLSYHIQLSARSNGRNSREPRRLRARGRSVRGHNLNAASAGGDRDRAATLFVPLCPSLSNGRTTPRCPQTDLQQRCLRRSPASFDFIGGI